MAVAKGRRMGHKKREFEQQQSVRQNPSCYESASTAHPSFVRTFLLEAATVTATQSLAQKWFGIGRVQDTFSLLLVAVPSSSEGLVSAEEV